MVPGFDGQEQVDQVPPGAQVKVLAVTCFTGGADLRDMTDEMLASLVGCIPEGVDLKSAVVGQGTEYMLQASEPCVLYWDEPENKGFGFGMNKAIDTSADWDPDYVLCLNNDLQFPRKNWLKELLRAASPDHICVPATNKSAIMVQTGPVNREPLRLQEMSAYCWLVPFRWCQWLKEHHGFWLFDEEFGSYGEDNYTAFLLSKVYGKKIFRYVRRSWVRHLRGRTAAIVKPNRRKSSQILIDRFREQLKYPRLRPDLQQWAKRYLAVLKGRVG